MGGGFYDRSLAYLARRQGWRKPTLLGLAHECQKVDRLAQASWDVPLAGTITDKQWYVAETPLRLEEGLTLERLRLLLSQFNRRIGLVRPQALRIPGGHDAQTK